MYIQRYTITLTTDADGDAVSYSPVVSGLISQIRYVKTDFADGVDFTVTLESTGESVWAESNVNASATRAPRQSTHTQVGVVINYAATFPVYEKIAVSQDRIKVVIAQGGNVTTGTLIVVME